MRLIRIVEVGNLTGAPIAPVNLKVVIETRFDWERDLFIV